jgi:hypothetical protein
MRHRHVAVGDAQRLQPVTVGNQPQARPGLAVAVVDVDDVGHGPEGRLDPLGHGATGRGVGAVDLGQQGGHHRRSRRRLDHLDRRARGQGQRGQPLAQVQSDHMA